MILRTLLSTLPLIHCCGLALLPPAFARGEENDRVIALVERAKLAYAAGRGAEAVKLATEAIELEPKSAGPRLFRGNLHAALEERAEAIADFDEALRLDPKRADIYDARGSQQFMLGHIAESIADFDKFLELRPDQTPNHWKRGISYYYAGRYDDGRKQFEGYQTVDDNDVENSVWRYLCMARADGPKKAREALLKIKADRRVPMMEVFRLFAGEAKPDDVLDAARAGNPSPNVLNLRLFYAELYLGLFDEANGDAAGALKHIDEAARRSNNAEKKGDYMGAVARVHAERLHKQAKKN